MIKLLKLDFKNCLNSDKFKLTFILLMTLSLFSFFITCSEVFGATSLEMLPTALFGLILGKTTSAIFHLILIVLPLITCIIYSDSYIYERDNNICNYFFTRSKKNKYFVSKIISIFIIVFCMFFFTLSVNEILTFLAIPNIGVKSYVGVPIYQLNSNVNALFLQNICDSNPYLYKMLLVTIMSLYSAFIAVIGFNISILFRIKRITLFIIMFLAVHLSTIILPVQFTMDLYIQALPYSLNNFYITLVAWIMVCILTGLIGIYKENTR